MATASSGVRTHDNGFTALNGTRHHRALVIFLMIIAAHWAEHAVQAVQVYVFGVPGPKAGGVLGTVFPYLVSSELLHWSYALIMLTGLVVLLPAFTGEARRWWKIALGIQVWHFIEHLILLIQAWSGANLLGRPVPTSVVQLIVPRVELHLIYNMIVLVPLLTAVALHWFREGSESPARCTCAARYAN